MARSQVFYRDLVRGPPTGPGFAVDNCIILRDENMRNAVDRTHQRATTCLADIKKDRNRLVQHFYIGKTHIRARQDREFDPTDTTSWDMTGIRGRFQAHRQTHYGRDGLIVLAVVTRETIPADCMDMQYIIHQEEYTLILERRLIERFTAAGDQRLANRGTDPGNTDRGASSGYVVYMTFALGDTVTATGKLKKFAKGPTTCVTHIICHMHEQHNAMEISK